MSLKDQKTPPRPRPRIHYVSDEEKDNYKDNNSTAPLVRISIRVAKRVKRNPFIFILILVLAIVLVIFGKELPPWIATILSGIQ